MNARIIGSDCGIADNVVGVVDGHAVTGKATQHTQVAHKSSGRRLIDKRVGRHHGTHALRLGRACDVPIALAATRQLFFALQKLRSARSAHFPSRQDQVRNCQ